ncbi:Beta-lactamase [Streptosporangium canum]|uniref:Beta-lactamase n=1 Tax=Streptosporangium canum TaxID=324952 RepID=A0A1I3USX0_9ACTN|nr:serine hydrolase [Streptosporangium canum]SFJ85903.1 Beta-lactamase [Streptosporangium canum]
MLLNRTSGLFDCTEDAAIGAVLEPVTGASLADPVRDRIGRPLNLKPTYGTPPPARRFPTGSAAGRRGPTAAGTPA